MKLSRRRLLHLTAGAAAAPALPRIARAQARVSAIWPSRPVRVFLGFPAGGPSDTITRLMTQWLSDRLGQPFLVENRSGAATNIAIQAALTSPPDGYALTWTGTSAAINATMYQGINFVQDGAGVGGLVEFPHVIVAHPSLPAGTLPELIAYLKANPGKISMASYGAGTTSHLAGELFKSMANVSFVHVPYRGDAQALPDLLSGRVDIYFTTLTGVLSLIRSGGLRGLALLGRTRYSAVPDVPTVGEFLPGYEVQSLAGLGVRKGTPREIIERLNAEMNAGLATPAMKARFDELAAVPWIVTPAEFDASIAAQTEKFAKVIRAANIKPE